MRNSLRMIQYTLYALLIFALSGCGANTTTTAGIEKDKPTGKIAVNLVLPKSAGKTVAAQVDVTKTRIMVTGASIPTAKKDFANNTGGTVEVYPGSGLIVAAYTYDVNNVLLYEGFATNVTVDTTTATPVTISLKAPVVKTADAACFTCHESTRDTDGQNLVTNYKLSGHYTNESPMAPLNGSTQPGCAGCHGTQHQDPNPALSGRCATCHVVASINPNHAAYTGGLNTTCGGCHVSHNAKGGAGCIGCHSISQTAKGNVVNDNNGVRAITGEFDRRAHHVTGRAVTNADCAVCHLEGKVSGSGTIIVDTNYHLKDNKTYLRNGNTGLVGNQTTAVGAAYPWDPANPDHTLMDQFCFSCHNEAGAPTAAAALAGALGYTGTALNPFGDTVSNAYDQVSRVNVVGVYEQFDTGNSSHHAVRGAKYTRKNLTAAQFTNISTANYNFVNGNVAAPIVGVKNTPDVINPTTGYATTVGVKTGTMFETGKFVATYTTLNNVQVADDSTLHCGDCHTVGQFKDGSAKKVDGTPTTVAIGAHGSNNEYLLRNSNSDDTFTRDALVCYLCHKENLYSVPGQIGNTNPATQEDGVVAHNSVNNSFADCNGNNENSAGLIGRARLVPEERAMDDVTFQAEVAAGTYQPTGGGNIFGIKCANCHNASDQKTFGGIHGNAHNAGYTSYSGAKNAAPLTPQTGASVAVSRKPYRFLPGLGNFRYNGGDSADQWTVKTLSQANRQGCYTLNGASTVTRGVARVANPSPTKADASGANVSNLAIAGDNGLLGSWGACTDHAGTSVFGGRATTRTLLRPLTY